MESYMRDQKIPSDRIRAILDQDIPRFEETTKCIERFVNKTDKILDISRTYGWESTYGAYLKSIGYDLTYFGSNDVRFKFDIPDNTYRVVLALEIFEHLNPLSSKDDFQDLMREARFFLKECKRILQKGGYLIITTPNVTDYNHIRALIEGREPYYLNHFREFTPAQINWEIYNSGLEVVSIDTMVYKSDPNIESLIKQFGGDIKNRGKHIIAVAKKGEK